MSLSQARGSTLASHSRSCISEVRTERRQQKIPLRKKKVQLSSEDIHHLSSELSFLSALFNVAPGQTSVISVQAFTTSDLVVSL